MVMAAAGITAPEGSITVPVSAVVWAKTAIAITKNTNTLKRDLRMLYPLSRVQKIATANQTPTLTRNYSAIVLDLEYHFVQSSVNGLARFQPNNLQMDRNQIFY